MSKFIKLSKLIINTSKIVKIDIHQTKYIVHMSHYTFDNLIILGFGSIESYHDKIEICEKKCPNDYKIMEQWTNQINYKIINK
jgi:hypothetical protein